MTLRSSFESGLTLERVETLGVRRLQLANMIEKIEKRAYL